MPRRYSLSFLTCLDAPPPAAIRTARDAGYDCIGLRLLPAAPGGVSFPLMNDDALMQDTLAALRDTGIEVFDVEIIRIAPGFSAAAYTGFFEAAARLGARSVLVVGDDADAARMTGSFAARCEAAHPFGLSMALEFMPQSEVHDAAAALRILRGAGQPNAAVIVDALHVSRSRTPLAELAAIPPGWMNYAQICDGPAEIPTDRDGLNFAARQARLLPGDGAIDLVSMFAALPAGLPISVEVPHQVQAPALGAEEWARQALLRSQHIMAQIDAIGA
jgi:sugar phosphate isomerase/epimerase